MPASAVTERKISDDGTCPITIEAGYPFRQEFWYETKAGEPISLSGRYGVAEIRSSPGGIVLLEFDVEVSQDAEGEADCGKVVISATADQTSAMRRRGEWDLKLRRVLDDEPQEFIKRSPADLIREVSQ